MSAYENLLKDLGSHLGLNLRPDANQSCQLVLGKVSVQIDLDTNADDILMGANLGQLLPGPYRNQIFRQALRINGLANVPRGVFAFTRKNDSLVLFQFLPLSNLSGESLLRFLELFAEHVEIWQEALARGEIPQLEEDSTSGRSGKMFGL